jgi:hypothetical protein
MQFRTSWRSELNRRLQASSALPAEMEPSLGRSFLGGYNSQSKADGEDNDPDKLTLHQ